MLENEISSQVIKAAIEVHSQLGPGLLESSYKQCLDYEFKERRCYIIHEKKSGGPEQGD